MTGLPRKSTKNQFTKLLKKSGKRKTNTASGATAVTKNISTIENKILNFEQFKLNEMINDKNGITSYTKTADMVRGMEVNRGFRTYKFDIGDQVLRKNNGNIFIILTMWTVSWGDITNKQSYNLYKIKKLKNINKPFSPAIKVKESELKLYLPADKSGYEVIPIPGDTWTYKINKK
jgi:hypothetical protein